VNEMTVERVHDALVKSWPFIENPDGWCQWNEAVTKGGERVDGGGQFDGALRSDVVKVCAGGAVVRGLGYRPDEDTVQKPIYRIILAAARAQSHPLDWSIGPWNDRVTYAEVRGAWLRAIAATAPRPEVPDPEDSSLTESVIREPVPA
jgi:hypothetical protein